MKKDIVIVGAGGFGREVAAMISSSLNEEFNLKGFIDDGVQASQVNNLPVLGGINWLLSQEENISCVVAIGKPAIREQVMKNLMACDNLEFPNIIHPNAHLHQPEFISMGKGNIICEGAIITTNVSIGNFNIINLSCTIGHDCSIGNFCSIMPGVNISGGAQLNDSVYVGTGAKLIKATKLENNCIIGAGSVVNTDVPKDKTFVGIPAREIHS